MAYQLTVSCCFCSNHHKVEITLPDGWTSRHEGADDEGGFCPDHANIAEFADDQCPGCVGGWGDCPMWSAFASSYSRDITPDDLAVLRTGRCPRRVNGTFRISEGRIKDLDISNSATAEAGAAFASAIEDYCRRYPAKS